MNIFEVLNQMTPVEKATLLTGKHNWYFNGVPRLGIREFVVGDGPHGLRAYLNILESNGHPKTRQPATMFPSASGMASSWNQELLEQVGETIGKECNHYNVDVILAPGINGKRSPLAGRNFEYYSEDPVLTAEMATSFVRGVQSVGVGTSIKHFVLNEQETSRRFISSSVDERTFREIYAYPFERVIKDANPLTIMGSYNKIDGIYACQNRKLLKSLLRDEWGYKGLVISDWGAVQDKRASILAGLDIEMPESEWAKEFINDVSNGLYDMKLIDEIVLRILTAYDWMLSNQNHGKKTNFDENHLVARLVANESICLLKNENSILPLSSTQKILILGNFASEPRVNGGGSSELMPYKTENPIEEINRYTNATFITGYEFDDTKLNALLAHEIVLIFTGTTAKIESEGFDRSNLNLPAEQEQLITQVAKHHNNVIIINASGSAIDASRFIDNVKSFVQTWFLGSACGKAIADVLFGTVNPSGKLSETFPMSIENTSVFPSFPGKGLETEYKEGLFTGYRFYDTHKMNVLFPFGFGLSYTTFEYTNNQISKKILKNNEVTTISIDVVNTGQVSGKEVVQCYIEYAKKEFIHPYKVLRAFKKVFLLPGETKTVAFELKDADFSVFVPSRNAFLVEKGEYTIHIGNSVNNIYFMNQIYFDSVDVCHIQKKLDFPADSWLSDEPERSKLLELLGNYRELYWWEKEEPLERILKRINQENGGSNLEYENMLKFIGVAKAI